MLIRMLRRALLLFLLPLAACGGVGTGVGTGVATPSVMPVGATMQLVVAASELVVGQNRFPLGLIMRGSPANDSQIGIHLVFTPTQDPAATPLEADAVYRGQGLPVGLYVAQVSFPKPGDWMVTAQVVKGEERTYLTPMRFTVLERASTPTVGAQAIPSKNFTLKDVPDVKQITSDYDPEPALYQMTIADALAAKKPFLVLFATPGFCKTATCGPNIKVVKKLREQFGSQMNFIHVEVYPFPFDKSVQEGKVVPTMGEWHLQTEPWTFLVNSQGTIIDKYEGGINFD